MKTQRTLSARIAIQSIDAAQDMALPSAAPSLLRACALLVPVALGCSPAAAQVDRSLFDRPRLLRTSSAQSVAGNEERFIILPSITTAYETNALPYGGIASDGRGNGRITPGIDVIINKLIAGRVRVSLSGSGGYDFNTRYKFFNQPRINFGGSASMPVGGRCSVSAQAFYQQFQFDQSDLTQTSDATSRTQSYDLSGSCSRAVGISPFAGVSYSRQSSDNFAIFNYETFGYRGGVSYTRPSLGTLSLTASMSEIRRPKLEDLTGINDGTDVKQISLSLARAVSPRLQFQAGGGYYTANPKRPGLGSTSGPSYNAAVTYAPSPRLSFTGSAGRNITSESGISSSYVRRDDFQLSTNYKLTGRSSLSGSFEHTRRNFNGEDILNATLPIRTDRVTQLAGYYSLDALRRLRFTAGVRHLWRDGGNSIYDYRSTIFSASVGARF